MKKNKFKTATSEVLKSLLFLVLLNFSFQTIAQQNEIKLLGKWYHLYSNNNYISFSKDSMEIGILNEYSYKLAWKTPIKGTITSTNETDNFEIEYKYYFIDEFLILVTIKETLNHIDEIGIYSKSLSTQIPNVNNSKVSVYVDPKNLGLNMIFLPNFDKEITNNNQRVIKLNEKFTESKIPISAMDYAFKNFEFILNGKKLPIYIDNELLSNRIKIGENEKFVCLYGFNQIGRKEVNSVLGHKVNGNILFIYIGEYKSYNTFPSLEDY